MRIGIGQAVATCFLFPIKSSGFLTFATLPGRSPTIHSSTALVMSINQQLPAKRSCPRLVRRAVVSPPPKTRLQSRISSEDTPKSKRRRLLAVTPLSGPQEQTSAVQKRRIPDDEFQDLNVPPDELRPSTTLTTGQCFHWKAVTNDDSSDASSGKSTSAWGIHNAKEWIGTLRVSSVQSVVVVIRETPSTTLYRVLHSPPDLDVQAFLREYFQLDEPLAPLYEKWSQQDERLGRIAKCIRGVRIIDQDPWECLASFICSSNNNIPRITKILSSIRSVYGHLLVPAGEHGIEEPIYSFPSLQTLRKKATDKDLRKKAGIGYRSKYILETMELLDSLGGEQYLHTIKEGVKSGMLTPADVQEKMIQFSGCGRKVSDCVALFSLKQSEAIPVDVHVWNIACRDYDPEGELRIVKSLTPTVYRQVEEIFRSKFTTKAGWAHSLLFVAELPSFRPVLPEDLVEEMDKVSAGTSTR